MCTCKQPTIESGCVLEYKIKSALHKVVETGRPAPYASTSVSLAVYLFGSLFSRSVLLPRYNNPSRFLPLAQLFRFASTAQNCSPFLFFFPSPRARRRRPPILTHRYRATCARRCSLSFLPLRFSFSPPSLILPLPVLLILIRVTLRA